MIRCTPCNMTILLHHNAIRHTSSTNQRGLCLFCNHVTSLCTILCIFNSHKVLFTHEFTFSFVTVHMTQLLLYSVRNTSPIPSQCPFSSHSPKYENHLTNTNIPLPSKPPSWITTFNSFRLERQTQTQYIFICCDEI